MTDSLAKRSYMVTGASAGIGKAIAEKLLDQDASVVGLDRDRDGLEAASAALGPAFHSVVCDLQDPGAIETALDIAWKTAQGLDGLVNAAGIYPVEPVLELDASSWDAVLDTNLRAPFLLTRAFAARLIDDRRPGAVVNISSTSSLVVRPGTAHYAASKAGLNQLTKCLALELARHGIRVNALAPGLIMTDRVMTDAAGPGAVEHQAKLSRIPLQREGRVEEIAEMALFLLSDRSSYATGAVFVADGGYSLGLPSY